MFSICWPIPLRILCMLVFCVLPGSFKGTSSLVAQEQLTPPRELTPEQKQLIQWRIERILERDKQFRSYLTFRTLDEQKIAAIEKLDIEGQLAATADIKNELSQEQYQLLGELQRRNDARNHQELFEIIRRYGYPGPERIGATRDRVFAVLLHPPVNKQEIAAHMASTAKVLLPEVEAGRFSPLLYATFIDNMRGKILGKAQLYGTSKMFDPKTRQILPPLIEDIEATNKARREIGLPELEEGEYRLSRQESASGDSEPG